MPRYGCCHFLFALLALCLNAQLAAQAAPPPTTTVNISGNVTQPLSLTVADLQRYPAHAVEYTPPPGADHKTNNEPVRHYTGVLLRDVLAAAKPVENKPRELRRSYVLATASDGYEVVFSWAKLFVSPVGDNVFLVYEREGAPLADDEGRIALIVTMDRRPVRHVKWLQALILRAA